MNHLKQCCCRNYGCIKIRLKYDINYAFSLKLTMLYLIKSIDISQGHSHCKSFQAIQKTILREK